MRFLFALLLLSFPLRAEEVPEPNYVFRAELVRIIDGNNVAMNIDLGFGVWVHNQSIGLLNSGGAGLSEEEKEKNMQRVAKMRDLFEESTDIIMQTVRDREAKPPRYIAVIWVDGVNLNEEIAKAFP